VFFIYRASFKMDHYCLFFDRLIDSPNMYVLFRVSQYSETSINRQGRDRDRDG
jgi:hypothetical protein